MYNPGGPCHTVTAPCHSQRRLSLPRRRRRPGVVESTLIAQSARSITDAGGATVTVTQAQCDGGQVANLKRVQVARGRPGGARRAANLSLLLINK